MTSARCEGLGVRGKATMEGEAGMLKKANGISLLTVLLLLVMQVAPGLAADLAPDNPRTMRFPTVDFNPPDADRILLENGMVVYLLEDHELPLVTINATLKTGSWLD